MKEERYNLFKYSDMKRVKLEIIIILVYILVFSILSINLE